MMRSSVIHDVDNYIESGKTMASLMIKKPFSCDWLHLSRNKYDPALDNYLISPLICQLLRLSRAENDFKDLTGVDTTEPSLLSGILPFSSCYNNYQRNVRCCEARGAQCLCDPVSPGCWQIIKSVFLPSLISLVSLSVFI